MSGLTVKGGSRGAGNRRPPRGLPAPRIARGAAPFPSLGGGGAGGGWMAVRRAGAGAGMLRAAGARAAGALGALGAARAAAPAARVLGAQPQGALRALRAAAVARAVSSAESGEGFDFRVKFADGGKDISPWHDIPLKNADGTVNFICEIPKETSAKMEVATDEPKNPIKQDTKKGKLRFYPYNINWNYGLIPQTWEDPGVENADLKVMGDNDPVDVVEIGSATLEMGGVYPVKIVGVLAMIDDGELDWKMIAVNSKDPKFASVNDVADVEREFPGEIQKILEWFRDYKIPDGKPANAFGYDNKCMSAEFAMEIVDETNEFYNKLKSGERANTEELALE